ncbi:hypothetical protein LB504_009231 [Fusarium proliferatum]|nr:hypothetical protein LB504_009231 [Fusarium proliferatum]
MSMLPTIANALAEFVYDKDIKFTSFTTPDEAPCFGCLTTIHRDARLLCVVEDSVKDICLCCQSSKKNAALYVISISLFACHLADFMKDSSRNPWRCPVLLESRLSAAGPRRRPRGSRAVVDQISDPYKLSSSDRDVFWTIQTQDAAATRELLSLQLLQSRSFSAHTPQAGVNFSPEEMRARVAAATPLYARDDSKAVRLRKALRRLPNAEKTPYGSDKGEIEDLPEELEDTLVAQMNKARDSGCIAPVCPPTFAGMEPVSQGPYPVFGIPNSRCR